MFAGTSTIASLAGFIAPLSSGIPIIPLEPIIETFITWIINWLLVASINLVANLVSGTIRMLLFFPQTHPGMSEQTLHQNLNVIYDNTRLLFFFPLLTIGALGQVLMSMTFPETPQTSMTRWGKRAFAAVIAVVLGKWLLWEAIMTANRISLIIYPSSFDLKFAAGGMMEMFSAMAVGVIALALMGLIIFQVSLAAIFLMIIGLAFRLLLIFTVYALFPVFIALWVTDTGPFKYARSGAMIAFKGMAMMLVLGLLISGLMVTGSAIAGNPAAEDMSSTPNDFVKSGDAATGKTQPMAYVGYPGDESPSASAASSDGGDCSTTLVGENGHVPVTIDAPKASCNVPPEVAMAIFFGTIIGVPMLVIRATSMIMMMPNTGGGSSRAGQAQPAESADSQDETGEEFDHLDERPEVPLRTQTMAGLSDLGDTLRSRGQDALNSLRDQGMAGVAQSTGSRIRGRFEGMKDTAESRVRETADRAHEFGQATPAEQMESVGTMARRAGEAGISAADSGMAGAAYVDEGLRHMAATANRPMGENIRLAREKMQQMREDPVVGDIDDYFSSAELQGKEEAVVGGDGQGEYAGMSDLKHSLEGHGNDLDDIYRETMDGESMDMTAYRETSIQAAGLNKSPTIKPQGDDPLKIKRTHSPDEGGSERYLIEDPNAGESIPMVAKHEGANLPDDKFDGDVARADKIEGLQVHPWSTKAPNAHEKGEEAAAMETYGDEGHYVNLNVNELTEMKWSSSDRV